MNPMDLFKNSYVSLSTPVATGLGVALFASLVLGFWMLTKRANRIAARRAAGRPASPEEKRKDTLLFVVALVPTALVWMAVMAVSFKGLTGFARDVMHWDHWTNVLVPLSLDGISVSFGAWAFVAVKRGRDPGRSARIVFAAAVMSAVLNFVHGTEQWSVWAGGYLAFLSMAGVGMFHEFLHQFEDGLEPTEKPNRSRRPRFGMRWVLAFPSTFCAWRTWIVYPPAEDVKPTVNAALEHLKERREQRGVDKKLDKPRREHAVAQQLRQFEQAPSPASVPSYVPPVPSPARPPVRQVSQVEQTPVPPVPSPPVDVPRNTSAKAEQPEQASAEVDDGGLRYVEHMSAVAAAFPDWATKMPTVRDANAAISTARGTKGSIGTTSKVLQAMKVLAASADPKQALEDLKVLRPYADIPS